ncbi:receptor-type guanylate cyclase Gyc76C-like [Centruroides sculpturatus]|uniref:receptor-type guanylate cyclase Gyc76C-like n=1 Tax=Centruroides sculpturatus TaxID=218467 RepID=UPI000C6CAAAB|nr:receptor-type guanylate cyclase Gyc76C-like [Centruroides sculpturatus]
MIDVHCLSWSLSIIFLTVLCPSLVYLETFKVGFLPTILGNKNSGDGIVIAGALSYAIEIINNSSMLNGHDLTLIYNDTKGDDVVGIKAFIYQWQQGAIAIFGPEDLCKIPATVATAVNLAMISFKCSVSNPENSLYYTSFASTFPPSTKIINSVIALLKHFSWSKFAILYEDFDNYYNLYESLQSKAEEKNFTITHAKKYNISYFENPFLTIIEETFKTTRVYVLLGDIRFSYRFLVAMNRKRLHVNGEYVVIYATNEMYNPELAYQYILIPDKEEHLRGDIDLALEAAQSLLVIAPSPTDEAQYEKFLKTVQAYNRKPPFKFPSPFHYTKHVTMFAVYLYDAVMLFADALKNILEEEGDPKNGTRIIDLILNKTKYTSISGVEMHFDKYRQVEGNYTLFARYPKPANHTLKGNLEVSHVMLSAGIFIMDEDKNEISLRERRKIDWIGGEAPLDEPPCGFDGSQCPDILTKVRKIICGVLACILLVVIVSSAMIYRNKTSVMSQISMESRAVLYAFTEIAMYRGSIVAIKRFQFNRKSMDIPRDMKKEMKLMRELRHDNINSFIGACVEPNCVYVLNEYCSKGSLQDVLENDDFKLDNIFIASLVFDLITGMIFLHESDLKIHGNLKSSNCIITSRWVLKVADFGLHYLRSLTDNDSSENDYKYFRNLLWKAPEILRNPSEYPKGSQKGDMYAFGIILHEIFERQGPYGSIDLQPKDIVEKVKKIPDGNLPFRPSFSNLECQNYILHAMQDAWNENPELRPEFRQMKSRLKNMKSGMKSNIMDNMMNMMEKYANNLEDLVEERTALLVEEKKKTVALLHRMLPTSVAAQLIRGETVIPESFDAVTIYFSDIVGFTEMSASSTPMEVVTFLNDLYTTFDAIIKDYEVYKVETIGDAYMVVSGLPIRNGDKHASEICSMALELLDAVKTFRIRHRPNQILKLRIGIHTGPVVAGVVGLTMPRYCLFGDTVNTASRMESNGEPLKIHISPWCKQYLEKLGGYIIESRGLVNMKGKGEIHTYWLLGHTEGNKHRRRHQNLLPLPLFSSVFDKKNSIANSSEFQRRDSLALRGENIPSNSHEDFSLLNGSIHGLQNSHRISTDSPRICKKFGPHSFRENRLRYRELELKEGGGGGFSCGDIKNHSNECKSTQIAQNTNNRQTDEKSIPSFIYHECSPVNELNKNGMITGNESLKPLLDPKKEMSPSKELSKKYFKSHILKIPSKKWRSCDEIIAFPAGSISSLKDFFSKRLVNKLIDNTSNNLANEPPPLKDESVV